jgi:hypothetical protein
MQRGGVGGGGEGQHGEGGGEQSGKGRVQSWHHGVLKLYVDAESDTLAAKERKT